MDSNSRIEHLLKILQEEPDDSFSLYALALEYSNLDEQKALFYFEKLLTEQEDYVPAYYHAAKLYAELDERERANEIYKKGLEISQKMSDLHASNELEKAYKQFLQEEDF